MEHFIVNHMSIIAARVELMRQVSTEHPVYALLSHHYKDSYGNIIFGVQALLQNGTAFDTVYGCGGLGAARYVGDRALTYNFTTQKINNWFTAAGTSNIPNYKYKADLLAIRAAVGQFVQNYLGIYYKSDSDVQKDPEIQAWAANTASPTGGNIVGFPKAFTTVFSLADTIADLIVFMTAQHNVMNGEATWDGQTFPAHPHSLYGPYPTKKGIASSRAYLAPVPQLIAAELALHSAFLIPTPSDSVLGFSYGSTLGVFSGVPIFLLQAELTVISVAIQVREASNPRKFLNLDPAQIPFQKLKSNYKLTSNNIKLLNYLGAILDSSEKCISISLSSLNISNSMCLMGKLQYTQLCELKLNDCGLNGRDVQTLADTIVNLKHLGLRANKIMDSGSLVLASIIPQSKLEYLNLEMNGIGRIGLRSLCKVLHQSQLKHFLVNFNEFDTTAYSDLQQLFIENLPKSQIDTATVYIESALMNQFAAVINGSNLNKFCFFLANDMDCYTFGETIGEFTLEDIHINYGKYVTTAGITQSLRNITYSHNVKSICFSGLKIGNKGLECNLQYLKNINPNFLDLSYCNLDDDVLGFLTNSDFANLKEIVLAGNSISSEGWKTMSFSIPFCKSNCSVSIMQLTAKLVTLLALPSAFAGFFNLLPPIQDFLSIPKNSPNITARNQQLTVQRTNFIDGPGFFTIANQPGYFPMPNGPQFTPAWYQLAMTELGEIAYRSNASAYLAEEIIPYDLVGVGIQINTLNDLTNMFYNFTSAIRFPYALINWQADASFGQDRLSWGGYSLQAETSNVLNIPDTVTVQLSGLTFAQLLAQNRMYKVDYSTLGKYSKSNVGQANPYAQSIPSTYLNLYIDASGNPYPLAIKVVDTGLIYTPLDAPEDWMFAKLAFSTSEGFFLPIEHFLVNHMSIVASRVELMRQVSAQHPVYALLNHHFTDSYGNIIFGIKALLQNGTAFDTVFGCGGVGASRYIGDRGLTYNFTAQKINNWFANAGTTKVPNYKYMTDLVAIRSAIATFVQNYLSIYYKSDADVQGDPEIQAWAANTASPTGGNIVGFPSSFPTLFSLVDTIADLITIVTAQHNLMNGEATWDGQTFPAHPHSLYGPYPTAKGIASSRAYLSPAPALIAYELALFSAFLVPTPPTAQLGFSYGSILGPYSTIPITIFQLELDAISVLINLRESKNARKFLNLDPAQIPFQVWV
ncbi:hypothetical protein HDV01_006664 [Terramyces sp. JEL0728]|nr:hypothetical protein HDV01_006664 [Terramyces sp. JEL0728]